MIISCFSDEIDPSLDIQIRVIRELGLRHLEIRTMDDVNVMDLPMKKIREIRSRTDSEGLTITCVSSPVGKEYVSCSRASILGKVKDACDRAHEFGCPYVRVFSFYPGDMNRTEALPYAVEHLKAMAEQAGKEGIVLVMEGGEKTIGAHGSFSRRILEEVASPNLRCAFDPAAFVAEGDDPMRDCYPALKDYIEYVHIKDACYDDEERYAAGEGQGGIPELLDSLRSREDLIISLEPHLSYAGRMRGFSGIEPFRHAHKALTDILKGLGISYR